jgi:hypothetical protein
MSDLATQNQEVTRYIIEAERLDREAGAAWERVAQAEQVLWGSLSVGTDDESSEARAGRVLERDIARRGTHTAKMKAIERLSGGGSSVVRPWVAELQWMCQTVLLLALRGCDTATKEDASKLVTRALRHVLLFNARNDASFMNLEPPAELPDLERYPQHWLAHTMHACEIIGYCHPDATTRVKWNRLYVAFCQAWHVNPESKEEMLGRLKGENG